MQYHEKRARARKGEKLPAPTVLRRNKVTFAEIVQDAAAYSKQKKRSWRTDKPRFERLKKWFGGAAASLTPGEIESTLNRVAEQEPSVPTSLRPF